MNHLNKVLGIGFFSLGLLSMPSHTHAQSALDDIKAKLENEGIEVIDYSQPEGAWGSLPSDWVSSFPDEYENLQVLAEEFEDEFIGQGSLTDLRRSQGILEAEKSQVTDVAANEDFSDPSEIESIDTFEEFEVSIIQLKKEILDIEYGVKEDLIDLVDSDFGDFKNRFFKDVDASESKNLLLEVLSLEKELVDVKWENDQVELGLNIGSIQSLVSKERELSIVKEKFNEMNFGASTLFAEIDFYYNHNKWSTLPLRVVGVLERDTDYNSLQDIVDLNGLKSLSKSEVETGIESLRSELGSIGGLTSTDRESIINAAVLLSYSGESQINSIGLSIANGLRNVAGALAALWIVLSGIRMIFAQGDENTITEQKRAILWGVIGLVFILIFGRMIEVIYGPAGQIRTSLTPDQGFSDEVLGIVAFIKAIIGSIAIFFIVLSGIRTITAQGEEDQVTNQRKSIIWIGVGLILLAIDQVIVDNIFVFPTQNNDQIQSGNVVNIIDTAGNVLRFILGFVGLITLGILVYGAATMVMNYGNDEQVQKSKTIIRNAIIGILVILSAYVIVASLVIFR